MQRSNQTGWEYEEEQAMVGLNKENKGEIKEALK